MDIKICSIKRLKYILIEIDCKSTGAILCSSYPIQTEWFKELHSFISFEFDDVLKSGGSSFNGNIANDIKNYIKSVSGKVKTLYVCCDSGESRSSALAAAIMRYKGLNDITVWADWHYHPNTLVYKMQCDAFGLHTSKLKLCCLNRKNKKALTKGINKSKRKGKKK